MYAHLVAQDDKEQQDNDVAKIEYAMGFYDGESVKKVQDQRAMEKYKPTDGQFSDQLQRMFGRGLPGEKPKPKSKPKPDLDQIKVVK